MKSSITRVINFDELESFADKIAQQLKGGEVILLEGELGAGKTYFTKMLGKALGISENIKSPTFVFFQKYQGDKLNLYHFDLYRIQNEKVDTTTIGIDDALEDENGVTVIEWSNLIDENLFKNFLKIEIKFLEENIREFKISVKGYNHLINF